MKFLDLLKKYNQAVVKENARLTSVYKTLLKESGEEFEEPTTEEETEVDADKKEPTTESDNKLMSASEFFELAEKEEEETTDSESSENESEEDINKVDEDDILKNRPHNAHVSIDEEECPECGKEPCECNEDDAKEKEEAEKFFNEDEAEESKPEVKTEEENKEEKPLDEDEWQSAADEFFGEDEEESEKPENVTEGDVEMMKAEEFFSECNANECDATEKETLDEGEDKSEEKKDEDAELNESLKEFQKKNHRLFNS